MEHLIEIIGWLALAGQLGAIGWIVGAIAVAVKLRHLQEVSHFAVHGVLTRTRKFGLVLTEILVHVPLGYGSVSARRRTHVRQHHPNATVLGVDPNLEDLRRAGLTADCGPFRFALATVFPLTPRGIFHTGRTITVQNASKLTSRWRLVAFLAAPVAAVFLLGWPTAIACVIIPRILLYPQLAWFSLLVEHRWFDAETVNGRPLDVEAARCLRLYSRRPAMALLSRATWLPYGDLYHFAHSVHPAVRWNYLPALERIIGNPGFLPSGLLSGATPLIRHHQRSLRSETVAVRSARSAASTT